MDFAKLRALLLCLCMVLIAGCNGTGDDLNPSGDNNITPTVQQPGQPLSIGSAVGQAGPDFTLSDTADNKVTLSKVLTTSGVVIYFAMEWCPICEVHLDSLRASVVPNFPNVHFYVVDYTGGSVAGANNWAQSSGYAGGGWTVLADINQSVLELYQATMGTTVVIDQSGVVKMNEDYKDGERLQNVLTNLTQSNQP